VKEQKKKANIAVGLIFTGGPLSFKQHFNLLLTLSLF